MFSTPRSCHPRGSEKVNVSGWTEALPDAGLTDPGEGGVTTPDVLGSKTVTEYVNDRVTPEIKTLLMVTTEVISAAGGEGCVYVPASRLSGIQTMVFSPNPFCTA